MNADFVSHESIFTSLDEPPMDLALAQHHLQKLNLASRQNQRYVQESIAYHLDKAEAAISRANNDAVADQYLAQIAAVRRVLDSRRA